MVVLAGRSAGDRLNVLRPAPTRLVHLAGDVDLAEDHHLHAHQRLRDKFVRLVERLAHDSHRARIRRGVRQAWIAMSEMIMIATSGHLETVAHGRSVAVEVAHNARIPEAVQLSFNRVLHPDEVPAQLGPPPSVASPTGGQRQPQS